jgi:hypothetical protein
VQLGAGGAVRARGHDGGGVRLVDDVAVRRVSAGTALGGWLVEAAGPTGALSLAVAAGVGGLLVGLAGQRHLLAEPAAA